MGKKKIIFTDKTPKPVGPYSQAVQSGDFIFVSGQLPIKPDTGEVLTGDIGLQARLALDNMKAVLKAAGCEMSDVVKTTIYIADIGQFRQVNEVYAEYFKEDPPARSTVGVKALPKGVGIEIEAIAIKDNN